MGRVAKYKKVKSFDPYSKQNGGNVDLSKVGVWGLGESGRKEKKRSRRAEMMRTKKKRQKHEGGGFDAPPTEKDDFNMEDIVGSVKRQKMENPIKKSNTEKDETVERVVVGGNVATMPKTTVDEAKIARMLKLDNQVSKAEKEKEEKSLARMEGESKRAYARRTKVETRQIIKKTTTKKNTEKIQKKKEFLKNKKSKKKGFGGVSYESAHDDTKDDDSSDFITGERAVAAMADQVHFGEQAERPPTFRQLPRGAKGKESKSKKDKSSGMTEEQVEAEKDAMEKMRRKVQAQYAAIKLSRRKAGDFHL